jgi:hypothetical protein
MEQESGKKHAHPVDQDIRGAAGLQLAELRDLQRAMSKTRQPWLSRT